MNLFKPIFFLFYFKQSIAVFILGKIATYIANESHQPTIKKDEASPVMRSKLLNSKNSIWLCRQPE